MNIIYFDKGSKWSEGCWISRVGYGGTLPRMPRAPSLSEGTNPFPFRNNGAEHGATLRRAALVHVGEPGELSISQPCIFTAGAPQGPGPRGCTDKTHGRKTLFHPRPPFFLFLLPFPFPH